MQYNNPFRSGPKVDPGVTYGGLRGNIAALLGYILFPFAIVALVLEKYNKFVRFHAMQALAVTALFWLGTAILRLIPFIGSYFLAPLFQFAVFIGIILLVIKAYRCEMYHIPWLGDFLDNTFL